MIKAVKANIVTLHVDAIVNAANASLLGGGGVDGAIHRAAGPELLAECRLLGGCETGQAKLTGGYNLPAKCVIHTVGPVWRGGDQGEAELLKDCYTNSLAIAVDNQFQSVAFPSISTGIFGYPIQSAATVAVRTVKTLLAELAYPMDVTFCCFSDSDLEVYLSILHAEVA